MSQSKKVSFLRGKRMRVTVVDTAGRPVYGEDSVVTSKGVVSLTYTTNVEDGEPITVPNMNGESCVSETATSNFTGFGVEAEFCEVDFALFNILTGQAVYEDEDGKVIGITEATGVDLSAVNFALEMWLGSSNPGEYGYVLTPFLGGGVVGDVTVENGAINFTVTGMSSKDGSNWGKGPHKVEKVGGVDSVLRVAIGTKDHRRTFSTATPPPAIYAGATPLLDPTDPALTDVTATVTGQTATLAPVPAGTDPVWYEFGDGQWDYAPTGGYAHTYDSAGTYTVTARRGSSTVTENVVIA